MSASKTAPSGAPLSLREKLAYGAGDTASNLVWGSLTTFLTYYYTDIFGLSGPAIAALFLFTRVFDGFSDLGAGALADRTSTRWGKFRPYLLWMSAPLALAFILTFTTPPLGDTAKIIYAWISYNLLMLAYTAINIPYCALSGVMTPDPLERTRLNSYRMVMAMVGGMAVNALTFPLIGAFGGGNEQKGYFFTACAFGAAVVVLFLLCFAGTRERLAPPPDQSPALNEDLRMLARNVPWIILFAIAILNMVFVVLRGGAAIHHYKYVMEMTEQSADFLIWGLRLHKISTLLVVGSLFFIVGAALAPAVVRLAGKRAAFSGAFFLSAASAAPVYWLGPGDLPLLVALTMAGSVAGGVNSTVFWTLIADTADYAHDHLGRRSTGIIFSATTCAQKLGTGVGGAAIGLALGAIGYIPGAEQTPETRAGLAALVSWVPAAGFALCGLLAAGFPLGGKTPAPSHHSSLR